MPGPDDFKPISTEELREFGRRIDSYFLVADSESDMYRQLNENYKARDPRWTMIRQPRWVNGVLVALVVRPRTDDDPEDEYEEANNTKGVCRYAFTMPQSEAGEELREMISKKVSQIIREPGLIELVISGFVKRGTSESGAGDGSVVYRGL